jgi:osmotically-inducible protein OsmY
MSFLKINVGSTNGPVVLDCLVPNKSSEARLIEFAWQVQGVKSVKRRLMVDKQQTTYW